MNVLSLFDGMSCGRLALERAGNRVDNYFASEIDKYAIRVTQANYPDTIQLGDICNIHVTNDGIEVDESISVMKLYGKIPNIIIAGSPCQGFSKAGKGLNFDDSSSKLFFEFVRILNEAKLCNPNVLFLLENVDMLQEWQDIISKQVGIQPIKINSSLVSAQNRVRLYWTNIGTTKDMFGHLVSAIQQPKDLGRTLKDILEDEVNEKYYLSDAAIARLKTRHEAFRPRINPEKTGTLLSGNQSGKNTDNGTTYICHTDRARSTREKNNIEIVVHNGQSRTGNPKKGGSGPLSRKDGKVYSLDSNPSANRIELIGGVINNFEFKANKANNIDANYFKGRDNHGARTVIMDTGSRGGRVYSSNDKSISLNSEGGGQGAKTGLYEIESRIRRLTPIECERLQGVADNYTNHVSDSQRYKMLGNGWQIDTIVHIFSYL